MTIYSCFHISFNCVFTAPIVLYYLRSGNPVDFMAHFHLTLPFDIIHFYNDLNISLSAVGFHFDYAVFQNEITVSQMYVCGEHAC